MLDTIRRLLVKGRHVRLLLANMFGGLRRLPVWPLPTRQWNPVDTTDVADYLIEYLDDGKRGVREEIGGPQNLSLVEMARNFQCARTLRRRYCRFRFHAGLGLWGS